MQAEKNGIGTQPGAKAALTQLFVGLAGIFFAIGIPDLRLFAPAAFENAKNIAGLRSFPAKKRIELRNYSFGARLFPRGLRRRLNRLRRAIAIRKGMRSLHEDGLRLVRAGATTLDEVLRVARI